VRRIIPAACLLAAALHPIVPFAQVGPACSVSGVISSGRTLLPGVVVSVVDADNHALDVSASNADGVYALKIPGPGRYTLKAEFFAFAPIARELTVDQASCQQRTDLPMTLASRAPQPTAAGRAAAAAGAALDATNAARRGQAAAPGGGGRGGGAPAADAARRRRSRSRASS
jgi:hypothetical protein